MSILTCARNSCNNVMCDRLSKDGRYYICYDCLEELIRLGPQTDVDDFMDSPKRCDNIEASRVYFHALFPVRD